MLKSLQLQNFRSYKKASFGLSPKLTLIAGKNTAGKTNFIEAIYYLSHGKSFKTEKDIDVILSGKEMGKISALTDTAKLDVILANLPERFSKKLLVNGISRRRGDFMGNLLSVLFSPEDLELVIGSPSLRRGFLNDVLEQIDKEYRFASIAYDKALRQRNSLLQKVKETGQRVKEEFIFWDNLLIKNGQVVTRKREEFIGFINRSKKELFVLTAVYDHSKISEERLLEYKKAEEGSGVTLVGPHRDDFSILINSNPSASHSTVSSDRIGSGQVLELKSFGSRGQQRLAILQLKLLQLDFIEDSLGERPLLLLDDIFSELDSSHIDLVMENINRQQTIITTTHKEFVEKRLKGVEVIELENGKNN